MLTWFWCGRWPSKKQKNIYHQNRSFKLEGVFDPLSLSCYKLNLGEQMAQQTRVRVATFKIEYTVCVAVLVSNLCPV